MAKPRSKRPASQARRSLVELTEAASRAADDGVLRPGMIAAAMADSALTREAAQDRAPCELRTTDSTAEMAAKIAKEYQARALDDIKVSLDAALDFAADLADRRASSSDIAKGGGPGGADADGPTTAATEYQAEALALMRANVAATLDYTQKLLGAKSSAEVVELSSSLARKQCELLLEQTRALRSFTRNVTRSG